jgi:hypothetical protein
MYIFSAKSKDGTLENTYIPLFPILIFDEKGLSSLGNIKKEIEKHKGLYANIQPDKHA